jgi:hypothetical protein
MSAAPKPPAEFDQPDDATTEDWLDFKGIYSTWLETATDEEIIAEMVAIPVEDRPLSPSEAWRFHECELRRRQPKKTAAKKTAAKKTAAKKE